MKTTILPNYMSGFGNDFQTEALPGALPHAQNSPQRCAYGLYAEQLSGSPFTAPHSLNERSWLYRILPSVKHFDDFAQIELIFWRTAPRFEDETLPIGEMRWNPPTAPTEPTTFITGIRTLTIAGDVHTQVTRRIKRVESDTFRMGCGPWRVVFSLRDELVTIEEITSGY